MNAIELGYAKEIWLGDKKVAYVYLGDKVVYPAIIGYEERTDYTDWVYSITITSGTRTRNWTSYKRAKYGNGTFGEWEQTGSGVNNETGTQSTSEVNTSGWTYAITFDTGYRTQTYQIRYTYTFSDATQYVDSTLQTRRQDATRTISRVNYTGYTYNWVYPIVNATRSRSYNEQAIYTFADSVVHTAVSPAVLVETESGGGYLEIANLRWIDYGGVIPANGSATGVRMNGAARLGWTGVGIINDSIETRVLWTSVDNGFTIGEPAIGWGIDGVFRRINNTSTNIVYGVANGYIPYLGVNWPIPAQTVSQAAGVIHYGPPVITAFGYPDIPASGGTVSPNVYNWHQPYTWNGVEGSGGTTSTGGIAVYSNSTGYASAGSKGTTASDRSLVTTMVSRVDANGVIGLNASTNIYQQANSATRTSSGCSGYTYTEYYTWTSGATSSWSQENSSACGYTPASFRLDAQLVTDWYTVQNIIGQDYADLEWWCGDSPDMTVYQVRGQWNATRNLVSENIKGYKYAVGGVAQSGSGRFSWTVPAYVTITNKSGGLGIFHWDKDLPEGGGREEPIPITGRYN